LAVRARVCWFAPATKASLKDCSRITSPCSLVSFTCRAVMSSQAAIMSMHTLIVNVAATDELENTDRLTFQLSSA
jgi:hypothetical protein